MAEKFRGIFLLTLYNSGSISSLRYNNINKQGRINTIFYFMLHTEANPGHHIARHKFRFTSAYFLPDVGR